jgi:hypothetical protein
MRFTLHLKIGKTHKNDVRKRNKKYSTSDFSIYEAAKRKAKMTCRRSKMSREACSDCFFTWFQLKHQSNTGQGPSQPHFQRHVILFLSALKDVKPQKLSCSLNKITFRILTRPSQFLSGLHTYLGSP